MEGEEGGEEGGDSGRRGGEEGGKERAIYDDDVIVVAYCF
jgi:hypothetical protein